MVSARADVLVLIFSSHAEQKFITRGIERRDVKRIIAHPDELFEDIEHNAGVAVGTAGGIFLVAVFRRVDSGIRVITVYHTRKLDRLVSSKLQRGAWRKEE